ncbi:MAG: [Clostridia bacterium]|nr:[FeFe] hydrogenase H-cluster radical SAM maturase HydE [Clostridia bacterium]
MNNAFLLAEKLYQTHSLSTEEYETLIKERTPETARYLTEKADEIRRKFYGNQVFVRGLIEISNICKNDCYYCGIRGSNANCQRYRLTPQEILECCKEGYALGFRTFVMQGGEDGFFTDEILCDLICEIKKIYPDCAVTLSLGERSKDSYEKLYNAGADRYLLRHEAVDEELYSKLHPDKMQLENRLQCVRNLKEIGFQTGCGFMVGAPCQNASHIAKDLKFIESFKPDMCGIGPFVPHKDTIFKSFEQGSAELTIYLLSIIRLICPNVLLPATTALGTVDPTGREKGILAGANVVMPNLSPETVRKKYDLYDNKISTGAESAQCLKNLEERMESIGFKVVYKRGDVIKLSDGEEKTDPKKGA